MLKKVATLVQNLRLIRDNNTLLQEMRGTMKALEQRIDILQDLAGRQEARQMQHTQSIVDSEFRVFSQFGEDGIIRYLLDRLEIDKKIFVEFGADNYVSESNTRLLLSSYRWSGLVIDGSDSNIQAIRTSRLYWFYNLKVERAFVTRENINGLIHKQGIEGEIGILSIDIDGNDFWIWQALEVIRPVIVIVEYNARFGPDKSVSIPYREDFDRLKAHASQLYYGASLRALTKLGHQKGYALVACSSNGVNAFFVRRDKLAGSPLEETTVEAAYRAPSFSENSFTSADGLVAKVDPQEEITRLSNIALPLVEI